VESDRVVFSPWAAGLVRRLKAATARSFFHLQRRFSHRLAALTGVR
jgi:hypothetical protein